MNAQDLLKEWEDGDTGLRPARVQALRHDLMRATGMFIPHRRTELEGYMDRMQGQITRRLREAAEAEAGDEVSDESNPPDEETAE